jgi:hypothetical protein
MSGGAVTKTSGAVPLFLRGKQGERGLSAYNVAVSRGYTGTEAQWLASLHGIDGKDIEVQVTDTYIQIKQTGGAWQNLIALSALTGSSALAFIRAADLMFNAAAYANAAGAKAVEYIDGDIVIPPGTCWVPTWTAVGTTVLNAYSVTWEEIPV